MASSAGASIGSVMLQNIAGPDAPSSLAAS